MQALVFIVHSILTLAVYAFLLRFLLPLARADFRNPLSQAVLALTGWLVVPLRRLLPPLGRLDTASLVALIAVQVGTTAAMARLQYGFVPSAVPLLLGSLLSLVELTLWFYIVMIFIYALLSFIAPHSYSPVVGILSSLCGPVLTPLRRILPAVGGLDFSPLVAIILLRAAIYLLP